MNKTEEVNMSCNPVPVMFFYRNNSIFVASRNEIKLSSGFLVFLLTFHIFHSVSSIIHETRELEKKMRFRFFEFKYHVLLITHPRRNTSVLKGKDSLETELTPSSQGKDK